MNIHQQRARIIEDSLTGLIEAAYQAGRTSYWPDGDECAADEHNEANRDLAESTGFTKGAIWALITRSYG